MPIIKAGLLLPLLSLSSSPPRVVDSDEDDIDYVYIGNKIRFHPEKYPQTKWGNPWAKDLKKFGRDKVVAMYREYIMNRPDLLNQIHELKDKTLGCWCKPEKCHGDILAELADK